MLRGQKKEMKKQNKQVLLVLSHHRRSVEAEGLACVLFPQLPDPINWEILVRFTINDKIKGKL
jgi:hypothetical protein